jgi:hypothetical protein
MGRVDERALLGRPIFSLTCGLRLLEGGVDNLFDVVYMVEFASQYPVYLRISFTDALIE